MGQQTIPVLKNKFADGKTPTGSDFGDIFDSYFHKASRLPQSQILGLTDELNSKATKKDLENVAGGIIYKPEVPTVADLATTYPSAEKGWAVKVTADEYIYQFDGLVWNNTGLKVFPKDVAIKDDLVQLEAKVKDTYGDYEDNPEYVRVVTDGNGKLLFAIRVDGTPYFPKNEMYSLIENEEFLTAWIDDDNKIVAGIRRNGDIYAPGLNIGLDNKVDKEAGKSLINENIANSFEYVSDVEEFLKILVDADNKVIAAIRVDGTPYFPKNEMYSLIESEEFLTACIDADNKVVAAINRDGTPYFPKNEMYLKCDDAEERLHLTLDADGKIVDYLDKDGVRVIQLLKIDKEVTFSQESLAKLIELLQGNMRISSVGDWSDSESIKIPVPRVAAKVNIIADRMPQTKTDDIAAIWEYWDKDGNYFRKPVIQNAQGSSSMYYPIKNLGIDFTDCEIKFGNWVVQDSFHIKKYYIDAFRGQCVVGYWFMEQIFQTRPYDSRRPWSYLYNQNINQFDSNGTLGKDFETGALGHPDGFPVEIYFNGEYYGLYSWQLKKHRDNYSMDKGLAEHIILDGTLDSAFFGGTIDWTKFEIRNPKGLVDINGNDYDGDNPKELSNTDVLSKQVKTYIENLASAASRINSNSIIADKKSEFERSFNLPLVLDYFCGSQAAYNYDGFAKNWIWVTYDGVKWTPTVYDWDSIFGTCFNGTFVFRNSLTARLGEGANLPTYYLVNLYSSEINARWKELRDAKIIDTDNIVSLFQKWVDRVGYDNYKREFKKYPDIPSYRDNGVNKEYWQVDELFVNPTVYPLYDEKKNYIIGEKCSLIDYSTGDYTRFGFTCIKANAGKYPLSKSYTNTPKLLGFYNSIERVKKWCEIRVRNLDIAYNY